MKHNFMNSVMDVETLQGEGMFEGYASVFDHTDSVRDRVKRGAFTASLARAKAKNKMPPLLWQHDTSEPIGKWHEIYEDRHGLYVKGELFIGDIPRARQAYKLITEEALSGLSIGFKAREAHRDPETGERVLNEIDLLEISLVTFPALESARVMRFKKSMKSGRLPDERCLEAFLRDAGFSRKQAKGFIAAGYKSLNTSSAARDAGRENIQTLDGIKSLTAQIRKATEKLSERNTNGL